MAWDYYTEGTTVRAAGVRILERLSGADNMEEVRYHVRHLCCDGVSEMTHAYIRKRERFDTRRCQDCGRKNTVYKTLDEYGVILPTWDAPAAAFADWWPR
jgi:hypothetical protein